MQNKELQIAVERANKLLLERIKIQSMQTERAIDYILDYPQPAALVHSYQEEDFYFLINDIGYADCMPILSLASLKQWEYLVDIETWNKDRIDIKSVTKWLTLLLVSEPSRFIKWFIEEKLEFIEFYLFKNVELFVREHDQDPSDFPDDVRTCDDVFYFRFKDSDEEIDHFISLFFERLAEYDHVIYQNTLFEFTSIIPAEIEEELYRLRNVRLAEKGFLPFDEAVEIYHPLKFSDLENQKIKIIKNRNNEPYLSVPQYPIELLENHDDLFVKILKQIKSYEVLQKLQIEFARLSNQIIVADSAKVNSKDNLKRFVKKASSYISIAFEEIISEKKLEKSDEKFVELIQKYPLSYFFRIGFGIALNLSHKVKKWHKTSWVTTNKIPLTFWDEELTGVLGGLLLKKPLYFDNYKAGTLYREFYCLSDIKHTESLADEIIAFDELLSKISIKPKPMPDTLLTYKNFLLTLWARQKLLLSLEFLPIPLNDFKTFFTELFSEKKNELNFRSISEYNKTSFLNWLSNISKIDVYDISQRIKNSLENLFNELENEYSGVQKKYLDPKFIKLFWIQSS